MMSDSQYIYIITRAHGLSTHLFTEDDYKNFVRLPDLKSFAESVGKGDYASKVSVIPREEINGRRLSQAFGETYTDRLLYIVKISRGKIKDFVDMFVRRIEVENIKRVLRAKFSGNPISLEDLFKVPREFTYVNISAMIDSPTFEDALYQLSPSPYKAATEFSQYAKNLNTPLPIELALDTGYYVKTTGYASKLSKADDLLKALGSEYGAKIVFYVLSIKMMGGQAVYLEKLSDKISRLMILNKGIVTDFLRAREDTALDILNRSSYKWIVPYIEESVTKKSVSDLYYWTGKAFKDYIDTRAARNPLNLVFLLWYMYAVEYEYKNLMSIALGKELGLKPEDILIY